jgi:hypothetical protein
MNDPSPAVAARDAEIFAAAAELEADLGKRPTRKELADYLRRTTGESCSAGRVTQAYRRQRETKAKATGETVKMDRAPGAGRKKAPLIEVVAELCECTLEVAAALAKTPERNALPRALYGAARRLRQRKGWRKQLRQLTAEAVPPPGPEQLELELDSLQTVRQTLAAIKRDLDAAESDADRRQHRKSLHEFLALEIRLKPPEHADEITMSKGDGAEWARSGYERLRAAAQRIREEQAEQLRAEGLLDKPDARRALRITRWLPKESEE